MGFYTKNVKQIGNYYEVVSENKPLSKQIYYFFAVKVFLLLILMVFMIN